MKTIHDHRLEVSSLELLGALSSRIAHDLANHLSIISGNAHFAQLMAADPVRSADAVKAILQATQLAGQLLDTNRTLRRQVRKDFEATECVAILDVARRFAESHPGWTVNTSAFLEGVFPLPIRWLTLGFSEIALESGSPEGTVSVNHLESLPPSPNAYGLPSETAEAGWLEIRFSYTASNPSLMERIRQKLAGARVMAVCEMVTQVEGRIDSQRKAGSIEEFFIHLPLFAGDPGEVESG